MTMNQRNLLRSFRDRDLAGYLEECIDAGWRLDMPGRSGHVALIKPDGTYAIRPDGRRLMLSETQYSGTATKQAITSIRRAGGPPRA